MKPEYLARLAKAFADLHGCRAMHLETVPVVETFNGELVWEGEVEVFQLLNHPRAKKGYAWGYDEGRDQDRIFAVLELPPVMSPKTAVQASIVAKSKEK